MDDAAQMVELQRVDLTWIRVAKRLKQVQQLLGENEQVRSARARVDNSKTALIGFRAAQENAELEC